MLGVTSEPLSQNLPESHLTVSTCPSFTEASQSQMFFTAYEMFEGHRTRKFMWFSPSRPGGTHFFLRMQSSQLACLPSQVVPWYNQTTSTVLICHKNSNHIFLNVNHVHDHIFLKYMLSCTHEHYLIWKLSWPVRVH